MFIQRFSSKIKEVDSRFGVGVHHFIDRLNSIDGVEDDLGGQGGPLQDVLSVSENAADGVDHIRPIEVFEAEVVEDFDVGAEKMLRNVKVIW